MLSTKDSLGSDAGEDAHDAASAPLYSNVLHENTALVTALLTVCPTFRNDDIRKTSKSHLGGP